jgi:hypothetical protein
MYRIISNFLFIFLFTFCCCEKKTEKEEIKTVYNVDEYLKMRFQDKENLKNIKIIDTFCINEKRRAEKDIRDNKLTYFMSEFECEFLSMKKHLGKLKIEVKNYDNRHSLMYEFKRNCYQNVMRDEIINRLGQKFIDSLMIISEKEFVINNPDSLYIKNGIDIRTKYKY